MMVVTRSQENLEGCSQLSHCVTYLLDRIFTSYATMKRHENKKFVSLPHLLVKFDPPLMTANSCQVNSWRVGFDQ